jgi:hypothetical protein
VSLHAEITNWKTDSTILEYLEQTNGQTDKRANRQKYTQTKRQKSKQTKVHTDKKTNGQTDKRANCWQKNTQAKVHPDKKTNGQQTYTQPNKRTKKIDRQNIKYRLSGNNIK